MFELFRMIVEASMLALIVYQWFERRYLLAQIERMRQMNGRMVESLRRAGL